MSRRRSPRRHGVRSHEREGSIIPQYLRGKLYPQSARKRVVVGEDKVRELSFGEVTILINGQLTPDERQGLDLWMEIQRFSNQLVNNPHIDYNVAGRIISKSFDHLRAKRYKYEAEHDIYDAYRSGGRAITRRDAEETVMSMNIFAEEFENLYQDKWRVVE